ncbi:hypothetical protein DHEL01_v210144 [Diaporthe helianthi]|uniref:DUF7587 domain-containing protein n=1 Tax=Diaporthe helianthi TaxID=158607 RepID=A0A2P5HMJ2_DIAHE|nr:hypothetical protein DHEL01_v210144 [Diaporthe helianthi]
MESLPEGDKYRDLAMEWYAGLDATPHTDPATMYVAVFTEEVFTIEADLSSIGWAVKTKKKAQGAGSFRIIITPAPMNYEWWRRHSTNLKNVYDPPCLEFFNSWRDEIFTKHTKGRALKPRSAAIRACVGKKRPKLLYRVVHDGHPGDGLQSRGYPYDIKTDPLTFTLHFHHHLIWQHRDPSPFMSTTTEPSKAASVAFRYRKEHFKNIEILIIQVDERGWPSGSRMWDVKETAAALGLHGQLKRPFFNDEYLIENEIPQEFVTRLSLDDMRADIDAATCKCLMDRPRKRKRAVSGSGGPEDGTGASDGRKCPRDTSKLYQEALQVQIQRRTQMLLQPKRRQPGSYRNYEKGD